MSEGVFNGSARAVYSAIAGAAAVGAVLLHGVYSDLARNERDIDKVEERMMERLHTLDAERTRNAERIRALESSDVEIETQFRAMATANNLERQYFDSVLTLIQACPSCAVPQREFYPSGPGPNGKPH